MACFLWVFLRECAGSYWRKTGWPALLLPGIFCLASLIPDLDVLPGLIAGDLRRFHNQQTHSLLFACAVSAGGAYCISRNRERGSFRLWWGLLGVCVLFHLGMDAFCEGRGLRLLWPLSSERFQAPVEVFSGLKWSEGFFATAHLWTLLEEGLFGIWLLGTGLGLRRWLDHRYASFHL